MGGKFPGRLGVARLTNRHNPHVTIDAKDFDKMMTELMRYTGKSFEKIIKHETARILEKAITKTNPILKVSQARINARYTYKDDKNPHKKLIGRVKIKGRRRIVRKIRRKGAFLLRGRGKNRKKVWVATATNPDWKPLQEVLKKLREKKKKRVGQSKGTWVYIAQRAGLLKELKTGGKGVPKYVMNAPYLFTSNLKAALGGSAKSSGKHNYVVILKNFGKVAMIRGGRRRGADGFAAFRSGFNGRVGYFKENLAHGVYEKTKTISKKYPGLVVKPVQNKRGNN